MGGAGEGVHGVYEKLLKTLRGKPRACGKDFYMSTEKGGAKGKLSKQQVKYIRAHYVAGKAKELATKYGVTVQTIYNVIKGRFYRDIS